jgi:cell wall-associated NlpC family hydrolase
MLALRSLVIGLLLAVCLAGSLPQPVAASATEAGTVMAFTKQQLGKPYAWGATGLKRYDCSGLVYRAFEQTKLLDRIGGNRKTALGYFKWFRDRGLVTKSPKVGDLVVWGKTKVTHIGIFAGLDSSGRAIAHSALTSGVAQHRVAGLTLPLIGYLSVNLTR